MMAALLAALAQLTVGGGALTPADILDARAIAGPTGAPIVMLTLTPAAAKRIAASASVSLEGKPVNAKFVDGVIELDGQPDFAAAKALAKALSGKDPVPEAP